MSRIIDKLCRVLVAVSLQALSSPAPVEAASRLQVSANKRFLVREDGSPFFYLGDTAWELFHRLNREEAELYLTHRAAQGFTVIQAVVLAEIDGLRAPNPYGHVPLENLALSTQCGFASIAPGNLLSVEDQWRKLELVVETARKVWG